MLRQRRVRRVARGQALVLFALSVAALIGLVGLSVDGLRVYIAFGQGQRAAEAAALAGVVYLPNYPTSATPAPDGNDATSRAQSVAAANGVTASAVTVTPVTGSAVPELHVTIRVTVPLSLVAVVDPAPSVTQPTAVAALLPPVALGSGGASFGDATEGLAPDDAAISGANELKERGDPYTPLCESGWSDGSDAAHADAPTAIYLTNLLNVSTNAPQYPTGPNCSPGTPGNPDAVPLGFGGLVTRATPVPTGQSYLITLPPGGAHYSVWVWNPRFVYTGSASGDQFFTNESVFPPLFRDAPSLYPHIAYTLFSVSQIYDRTADVPLAALWPTTTSPDTMPNPPLIGGQLVTLPPLDATFLDLLRHGCSVFGGWNVGTGACLATLPSDYHGWVQVGAQTYAVPTTGPRYLRLTVDAGTGYGLHGYAVKVCQGATVATGCASGGAMVAPWNAATIQPLGGAHGLYPLATIPAAFAGRQIALDLFNPGTGSGNVTMRIVPPAGGGAVVYPAWARMTTVSGQQAIQTSLSGDNLYHAKWVRLTLMLPPDYAGGTWQLAWDGTAAPASSALMTVSAALVGKPVALLPG